VISRSYDMAANVTKLNCCRRGRAGVVMSLNNKTLQDSGCRGQ